MEKIEVKGLRVAVGEKEVLSGIDLVVEAGRVHAVMGPNGSGKSTLAHVLMGDPVYKATAGTVVLAEGKKRVDLLGLEPDERAKLGVFLSFQNPVAIPGVSVFNLLRMGRSGSNRNRNRNRKSKRMNVSGVGGEMESVLDFYNEMKKTAGRLGIGEEFLKRSINDGFSGGERKKVEVLQMLILKPKFVLLDELDTGLDVDALKMVARAVKRVVKMGAGVMLITHYTRILKYLKPDFVHVIKDGKIVSSGSYSVAKEVERHGYESIAAVGA